MPANLLYLLVTLSAFFWGANFVLAGWVLADMPPLWAAALRFLIAAALMLVVAGRRGEGLWQLVRRHAAVYGLLGLVGVAGFNLLFFNAMQATSAENGALIMATNPLLTTVLAALLLGERIGRRHLAALPVALAGVAVVVFHGDLSRVAGLQVATGDLLMLAANVTWALFNVGSRRYMPQASPIANNALLLTAGAGVLLVAAMAGDAQFAMPGLPAGAALLIMALAGTVLAYVFWGIGIQHLGAGRTSLFLNLVPVSAMLVSGLLGHRPMPAQVVGGLLVLAAVTTAMMPVRRPAAA